jgi:Mg/Co/Ni transporter MgtE
MVKALEETLKQYRLTMPQNVTEAAILEDNTVKQILQIMKDNQNRHEKSIFSTASTFNIQTLQSLPDELRKGVCKKLGIEENSKILKEINYSTRKELAAIISKYTPSTTARPSI